MKWRLILIAGLVPTCWLGMMLVHEGGHMLAAITSGGAVTGLEFPLWGFSRTEVSPDPHPLLVAWAGPLLGAGLPLLMDFALRAARRPSIVAGIFSGFCLLANGAYLSAGSLGRVGDTAVILKHGSPMWTLWVVGFLMVATGLIQWHMLGPALGVRRASKSQSVLAAVLGVLLLIASGVGQITTR